MNLFSFSGLLIGITSLILITLLLRYGKSKLHKLWAFFNLTVAIWGLGGFFIGITTDKNLSLLLWRIAHIGVIFISISFYHVTCIFTETKQKTFLFIVYLISFIFLYFNLFTDIFIPKLEFLFNSFYYAKSQGIIYPLFFLFWISLVTIGHIQLLTHYKSVSSIRKNQILYFLYGVFTGFAGGVMNFFPILGWNIYPYGNLAIPIYCIIVTYAIIRYRLMDITIVISRTGIFVVVYSFILGIPFIIAYSLRPYFIGFFGDKWWLVPMGLLTVLATAGPFIFIYINKKAEDRLLQEQRQYQNTLRQASSGMIRVRELKKLLNLIVHVVTKTVKLEFASIFLLNLENNQYIMAAKRDSSGFPKSLSLKVKSPLIEQLHLKREPIVYEEVQLQAQDNPNDTKIVDLEKQLREIKAAVVIPSYVGNKLLGFIVLGKKLSGKIYSQDDLNVFSVLANQAALAIENAQFYEDIKQTQQQLFQAEKMATIGTMADGLSHQINNRFQALSLITGDSLDILKTIDLSNCASEVKETFGQLKHAFERIQSNVMQGGEIVKGLLKYSRPGETGFEAIDFNQVIDGALEMVQYKVRLSELDIQRNIPQDLPKLKCNLTQLEEIFFNLIDNAYDAIKERKSISGDDNYKGKIIISAEIEDNHIRIIFQDNGIGVKDKDKEHLFTPFFTTKSTNKKGTGLGLYVIQKIVGFHDGTISIDSTYNVGTTFEIVLPLSK